MHAPREMTDPGPMDISLSSDSPSAPLEWTIRGGIPTQSPSPIYMRTAGPDAMYPQLHAAASHPESRQETLSEAAPQADTDTDRRLSQDADGEGGDQSYAPLASREEQSQRHMQYAVELLIFAFIGWAWLAIREYLGNTPVLDVSVVLSTVLCSVLNLTAALICGDSEAFAPFAQAYLSHAVGLAVLYAYGLGESVAPQSPSVACSDGSNGTSSTVAILYREAYFGGLMLHQVLASFTLGYLCVMVLLSAAQTRACIDRPRYWFLRGTSQCAGAFVVFHLVMFSLGAPLQDNWTPFAYALCVLALLALAVMVDLNWVGAVWQPLRGPAAVRKFAVIQGALEILCMGVLSVMCNVFAALLSGGQLSTALMVTLNLLVLLSAVMFWNEMLRLYQEQARAPTPPSGAAGAAPVIGIVPAAGPGRTAAALRTRRGVQSPLSSGRDPPAMNVKGLLHHVRDRAQHSKNK
jgi:hypothetical protein